MTSASTSSTDPATIAGLRADVECAAIAALRDEAGRLAIDPTREYEYADDGDMAVFEISYQAVVPQYQLSTAVTALADGTVLVTTTASGTPELRKTGEKALG